MAEMISTVQKKMLDMQSKMMSIEKGQRSNKKELHSLLETQKEMEKTMKRNTYEINMLNNTYSIFEKNFFKRQSERFDCEREFNIDLHQEVMAGMNLVQGQMVELTNHMNRVDAEHMEQADSFSRSIQVVENVEDVADKEKSLIALHDDNVKKGEGSSRGSGSSSLRGGALTGTRSKRKVVDEGGCRLNKRGGGRGGDRGGGSGGRGGRNPSGGRALPQFHNLLTGDGFADPNVKREEQ
ncbi:keratin, type I cytoskeletal 9-like [Impatiens glandulifera]|uniref:keratin, type I cytoskeletal 9-like n=1 Tax=Impatiens glandulifera TaxID=253017 RepID=UPI001FB11D85|nr:keratin, type I cytoskeletal 9-like [Impatiens glandulifera]